MVHSRLPALCLFFAVGASSVAQDGPPPALVVTEAVAREAVVETVELIGAVRPIHDSLVASEVPGRVIRRAVELGDHVKRGKVLVRLDATRLEKDLARVQAEFAEATAQFKLARSQENRARQLFDREILSRGELDEAVARLHSNDGRVGSIQARIASIEHEISRTTIRAPFAGVVTEVHTEIGEWIDLGSPVLRLSDLKTVEIRLDVPEHSFRRVRRDAKAEATVTAVPGLTLAGKIFSVVPRADPEARTFPVLVRAPNPGLQVGAGMLAKVDLALDGGGEALLVSKDAVVRQAQQEVVWIVENDTVRAVSVRTRRGVGDRVEIVGDVQEGDRVVVRGNERLMPGQPVVVETAAAAR